MKDSYLVLRQERFSGVVRNQLYLTSGGWVVDRAFAIKFSLLQASAVADGMLFIASKNPLDNTEFLIVKA